MPESELAKADLTCTGLVLAKLESSVCKFSGVASVDGPHGSVKLDVDMPENGIQGLLCSGRIYSMTYFAMHETVNASV